MARTKKQQWQYYDFDKNWSTFLTAWKSPEVQDELDVAMDQWQEDNPTYDYTNGTRKLRVYKRGDMLWEFGRTDYWHSKIYEDPRDEDEIDDVVRSFEKTLMNVHPGLIFRGKPLAGKLRPEIDEDLVCQFFTEAGGFDDLSERQYKRRAPKPDTLESLVMIHGKHFLLVPMYTAAMEIFGEAVIAEDVDGNEQILIPEKHIVFDLYSYYFTTRDGDECLQPDKFYDTIVENDDFWEM